ncbi:MAG TPA: hypothetical protein VEL51_07555 [Vicinamibacterales bacterium]|nr:hypothetical protein [Vicinamibacterales bacterium]
MMKMHEQMMAEMNAADRKFDALVKDMNAAKGDAKVNAIAAVVSELVRQQKSMHDQMGQMHQQMMRGRGMRHNDEEVMTSPRRRAACSSGFKRFEE